MVEPKYFCYAHHVNQDNITNQTIDHWFI